MNLYSKLVPAGRSIEAVHSGLDDVYFDAESSLADAVSQFPSCGMDPTIFTVCPTTVVVFESNVTETVATGEAHAVPVAAADVVVEGLVVVDGGGLELPDPEIAISAQVE